MQSTTNYTENYTTNQLVLPLDLGIKIKKDSEVYTYLELTKGLALETYFEKPKDKGRQRKNRVQILNAILFGFMVDIRSTRALASACLHDIRFMMLLEGMNPPSHQLINDVMNDVGDKLTALQTALIHEIMMRENVNQERLYIDGTKVEADANKYSFRWKRAILSHQKKLYQKISRDLPKANALFEASAYKPVAIQESYSIKTLTKIVHRLIGLIDQRGLELVYGKGKHKSELQRIYDTFKSYLERLESYQKDLTIIGPQRNSYAKTDHDATFMHMKDDHMRNAQLKPGYNVQIGVSNEYIMVIEAFQNGSDHYTFQPLLEKYHVMYDHYPAYPVADAGYGSYDNYAYCLDKGMGLYQKYGMWAKEREPKFKHNMYNKENFRIDTQGRYRCPNNKVFEHVRNYRNKRIKADHLIEEYECFYCSKCRQKKACTTAKGNRTITFIQGYDKMKQTVIENLDSPLGIELRVQRSIQVEGAFGIIKEDMRFRRFTRTGFKGIRLELDLITIGYNLKKYHNKQYR